MVRFKKYYHLIIITACLIFTGCNEADTNSPSKNVLTTVSLENTKPATPDSEGETTVKNEKSAFRNKKDDETLRPLTDGSQYVMMTDAYGNKTEIRYFEPTTSVKYISVQTMTDGTTTTLVRTWTGSVKRVAPSVITNPWRSSAQEIALLAGVPVEYHQESEEKYSPPVSYQFQSPAKPNNQTVPVKPAQQTPKPSATPANGIDESKKLQRMLGNVRQN